MEWTAKLSAGRLIRVQLVAQTASVYVLYFVVGAFYGLLFESTLKAKLVAMCIWWLVLPSIPIIVMLLRARQKWALFRGYPVHYSLSPQLLRIQGSDTIETALPELQVMKVWDRCLRVAPHNSPKHGYALFFEHNAQRDVAAAYLRKYGAQQQAEESPKT